MERLAYDNGLKIETPLISKIRNEGRQEGREEGREEGRRQEHELMTLDFLNQRFDLDSATITRL